MSILCTIITIGDELLIGQTIDTNSAFIAQRLAEIGIKIYRRIAISDNASEIAASIQEAAHNSSIIVTTGGLGPTKDDITKKTIAELLGESFRRDQQTYEHVQAFFESRKLPFTDINQLQADVPISAEVLFNARGTAPGMWTPFQNSILISLPGVPFEMEYLMVDKVLPRLKTCFPLPALYYRHILTAGIGESILSKKIEDIESELPENISLAYLPSPMSVHLRLSGTQDQFGNIDKAAERILDRISSHVYGTTNHSMEAILLEKLIASGKTLATVESCTGGYISNILTDIKGSSQAYLGGWTVYSDAFKNTELKVDQELLNTYTAVSQETCQALHRAAIAQSGADYAIAVVGYLEKSETIQEAIAYICYGDKNRMETKTISLFYPRVKSKEAICKLAFFGLLKDFLPNM